MGFKVKVCRSTGKQTIFTVESTTTVEQLKQMVEDASGTKKENIQFIYAGKALSDKIGESPQRDATMQDYEIKKGTSLYIAFRVPGGTCKATVKLIWQEDVTITFELSDTVQQFRAKIKSARPTIDLTYAKFRYVGTPNQGNMDSRINLPMTGNNTKPMREIVGDNTTPVIVEEKGRLHGTHPDLVLTDDQCCVSYDDDPEDKRAQIPGCKHAVASATMQMVLNSVEGMYEIRCPGANGSNACKTIVPYSLAKAIAMSEPGTAMIATEKKLAMAFMHKAMDVQTCPHCKCYLFRKGNQDMKAQCMYGDCKGKTPAFCWYCVEPWTGSDRFTCTNTGCTANAQSAQLAQCEMMDASKCASLGSWRQWNKAGMSKTGMGRWDTGVTVPRLRRCPRTECQVLCQHDNFKTTSGGNVAGHGACPDTRCGGCRKKFCWICLDTRPYGTKHQKCTVAERQA